MPIRRRFCKHLLSTDFTDEHFLLHLTDYFMAFAQKGSIFTFDIDDVDGSPYTYNSGLKQISFEKSPLSAA